MLKSYILVLSDLSPFFQVSCFSYMAGVKLQKRIFMDFSQQWLSCCHCSIKVRFVKWKANPCPINSLSHLSCGSLQLFQLSRGFLAAALIPVEPAPNFSL
ncbi:hypothetical protein AMECASPLE_015543 [Ameca splendens]|uniref:Uncharacterized protein n=1 Tax=Ameca splendens TaxID=208324 RepID=A0ABV0XQZ1_9TELE